MSLEVYRKKRNFRETPEPRSGGQKEKKTKLTFVVQKHHATRLHYDFRLEMEGVLKSWAIPKGPSMVPGEKRLAIMVEDHPLPYGKFYGEIPEGNYGAGTVEIWDKGTYKPSTESGDQEKTLLAMVKKGDIKLDLKGTYLNGRFALFRLKNEKGNEWMLVKKADDFSVDKFDIEAVEPLKSKKNAKLKKRTKNNTASYPVPEPVRPEDKPESIFTDGEKEKSMDLSGKKVKLTNLTKVYWPSEGYTKGDLISYYYRISRYILPYLKDRPQSLNRHPDGINASSFYHKDMDTEQIPGWLKTVRLASKTNEEGIDYLICNDVATLLYMANLGCIEINPWHSTYRKPENPTWLMIDIDPGDISFTDVVNTALVVKELCDETGIPSYCKTSGATGLHVYIPLGAKYDYEQAKMFAEILAGIVHNRLPSTTSIERSTAKRKDKVYVDFLQNRKAQTIAAPYSVRPQPFATVSTPLDWKEVNHQLSPRMFTIWNIEKRLENTGDLWEPVLSPGISINKALRAIEKLS
jgi:bifunctional non-homologous end joining protein LigD